MITRAEVEKLGALHAVEPTMLSLYLAVPPPPVDLAALTARAAELIATAGGAGAGDAIREKLALCARDWPGHTVAIFACAGSGLLEAVPLPCALPERAVLGIRPHIRPLLVALERCPAYHVAVVDQRRAWVFSVAGGEVESVSLPGVHAGRPSAHHLRDTAAVLERLVRPAGREPVIVGGHDDSVRQLLAAAPAAVREAFAGSFTADTRTLTAARVRDLAAPVVARWADVQARRLAGEILAMPPGGPAGNGLAGNGLAAIGLTACLAAVNAGVVATLIVPDDVLVPGYECGRCGALSLDADSCPDWGTAPLPVPDVIEEMVSRTLEDGGEVSVVCDGSSPAAARLHVPLPSP
jgi:hypothetical protein